MSRHSGSFLRHATPRKLVNLIRVQKEMYQKKEIVTGYPYEIIIDVTNRCNLRCPLCVTGQRLNQRPLGAIRVSDFLRVIDELAPYLFKVRLHSWGEPFLHEHLYDMITVLSARNIGTEVSTNLTVFHPNDASSIFSSGLELLIVSLDGATEDVYRKYRIGGEFHKVLDNIRVLTSEKKRRGVAYPLIEIQFLLMSHNIHQKEAVRKLSKDVGADRCMFVPVALNVFDEAQRKEWLPEDLGSVRYDPLTLQDKIYSTHRVCPWLWRSAVINWDGTVSPCCLYEGPKSDLGTNVFEKGFRAIWNNEAYRSARRVFAGRGREKSGGEILTICHRCRGLPRALTAEQQGQY